MTSGFGISTFYKVSTSEIPRLRGFSRDPARLWTNGERCGLGLTLPRDVTAAHMLVRVIPFLHTPALAFQDVTALHAGEVLGTWRLTRALPTTMSFLIALVDGHDIEIEFCVPTCRRPCDVKGSDDTRALGFSLEQLIWIPLDKDAVSTIPSLPFGRAVGSEANKTYDDKILNGFWNRFINGPAVLDVGFKGYGSAEVVPIVEGAIGVDLDYPGYDGIRLPFPDNSQNAVFSSHCLEHISDYVGAIRDWHRVTKVGGHIITVVPSAALYERSARPPSLFNSDHKRFYSPSSLLREFEDALKPNTFRVRHLRENDEGYRYDVERGAPQPGCYEIELVVEKICGPNWDLRS